MKRKHIFLGLIAVILAAVYWFGYHRSQPTQQLPLEADAVVVLDAKSIRNDFIWDFLQKPNDWFKSDTIKTIQWHDALEIPDYLTLFHLQNENWTTWNVVLKINNLSKLKSKFKRLGLDLKKGNIKGMQKVENTGYQFFFSQEYIWFQFGNSSVGVEDLAFKYLKNPQKKRQNSLNIDLYDLEQDGKIIGLKNSWLKEKISLNLAFSKSEWTISGKLPLNFSWQNENLYFQENPIFSMAFALPKEISLDDTIKNKFHQLTQMHWDSLQKYQPKNINFQLLPSDIKRDTLISYDYDDDFNEIEVETIEERFALRYFAQLELLNPSGFKRYISQSELLEKENNQMIFTPIPLEKTYLLEEENYLNFYTSNTKLPKNFISKNACFLLELNLNKMDDPMKRESLIFFPWMESLIKHPINLNARIYSEKNSLFLKGKIKQKEDKFLFGIIFD